MIFKVQYQKIMKTVDEELKRFMDEQISTIQENPFLEYYCQQVNSFLFSGGKRIRPVLMILAYGSIDPSSTTKSIYRASLSIELLHNASLIHDDIMDYAETRRGKKAFHIALKDYSKDNYPQKSIDYNDYGVAMGILGGDFVYNLAYKAAHFGGFPPEQILKSAIEFNEGFFQVVKGVIFETDMQGRFEVTEKQYLDMINGKTAALFEKSAVMGAIYAGATDSQVSALGSFARNAGIAFQIVDDVIGTFGDEKKTGKPTDSDIKEGKKTILLIKTIELADENQRRILKEIVGNRNATPEEIENVRDIMKDTGALDYANEKAEELYKMCILFLDKTEPALDKKYREYLVELAKMGVFREK